MLISGAAGSYSRQTHRIAADSRLRRDNPDRGRSRSLEASAETPTIPPRYSSGTAQSWWSRSTPDCVKLCNKAAIWLFRKVWDTTPIRVQPVPEVIPFAPAVIVTGAAVEKLIGFE